MADFYPTLHHSVLHSLSLRELFAEQMSRELAPGCERGGSSGVILPFEINLNLTETYILCVSVYLSVSEPHVQ